MLERILNSFHQCDFDFRKIANPEDPLEHLFTEWVDYYRLKCAIAAVVQPRSILEIGVRYGYSAAAFLHGAPTARFTGVDVDSDAFGGNPGAIAWARRILPVAQTELIIGNTQQMARLPGGHHDLIHIDGQQDGDGTFRDLLLASRQARYILVDGYLWSKPNFHAASEFLYLHRAIIEHWAVIPGYAGELLIKLRPETAGLDGPASSRTIQPLYDKDYFLCHCSGWDRYSSAITAGPLGRIREVLSLALAHGPRTLLDLGCGRGEIARAAADQGCEVQAIDYSSVAIELTSRLAALPPASQGKVTTIHSDIVSYRPPQPVDCIVLADVIEHLSEAEAGQVLAAAARQLGPNGRLILHTAPNRWYWSDHYPRQRRRAAAVGAYLPPDQRTYHERHMHLVEQSPSRLSRLLRKHFAHVVLWLGNPDDPAGSLLRRMGRAELSAQTDIFAVASPCPLGSQDLIPLFQSLPLPVEIAARLELTVLGLPQVHPGRDAWVPVELYNRSNHWLVSRPPFPIHLSYHLEGDAVDVFDGVRTSLVPPLAPGGRATYRVRISAPHLQGRYRVTITLVQESIRWLDSADGPAQSITLEVT